MLGDESAFRLLVFESLLVVCVAGWLIVWAIAAVNSRDD